MTIAYRIGAPAYLLLVFAVAGCTHFHENYYVGMYAPVAATQPTGVSSLDSPVKETQLYKYEISGWSWASKTQFASGLYDARVVDRLLGEIRPARAPATQPGSDSGNSSIASGSGSAGSIILDCVVAAGGASYQFSQANCSTQSGPHLSVQLSSISQLQASQITGVLDAAKQNILLSVTGVSNVTISDPTLSGANSPTICQINGGVVLSGVPAPGAVVVMNGGHSSIFTIVTSPANSVWQGAFANVAANTDAGFLGWSGLAASANFVSQGANVVVGAGVIDATGGITSFSGVSAFNSKGGFKGTVSNGGQFALSGKCSLTLDTAPAVSGVLVVPMANAQKILVDKQPLSALVTSTSAATSLPTTVTLDTGYFLYPVGTVAIPVAAPASTTASFSDFQADKLQVAGGTLHAASEQTAAKPKVPRPAPKPLPPDTKRKIFVKIGPEGEAIAQSDAERMVIFMSSDPQALTDRISAMSNAQQSQAAVTAVLTQQHTNTIQSAQDDLDGAKAAAGASLTQIQAATPGDNVELIAKQFIQHLQSNP